MNKHMTTNTTSHFSILKIDFKSTFLTIFRSKALHGAAIQYKFECETLFQYYFRFFSCQCFWFNHRTTCY